MYLLGGKNSCHEPAEGMGSVGNEDDRILDVLLQEFLRIGVGQIPDLSGTEGSGSRGALFQLGNILPLRREDRHRVRILSPLPGREHLKLQGFPALHLHRGNKGADTDGKRPADIALVHLEDQGSLARDLLHQADDLIGEIGVMPAAETDDLDILQIGMPGSINRRTQHSGMVIVDHVEPAL